MSVLTAWKAFGIQVLGFGLLVYLFGKLAWPGLSAQLRGGSDALKETYRRLDAGHLDALRALEELEQKAKALPQEEEARVARARAEGERLRNEMVREAEAQAGRIVEKARREIEIARDAAVIEVRQAVLSHALEIADARVRTQMDIKTHHTLVNGLIVDLAKASEEVGKGGEA